MARPSWFVRSLNVFPLIVALAAPPSFADTPAKISEVNATADPSAIYSETSVAINPADPRQIVVGANYIQYGAPMAVFRSVDRGATYTRAYLPKALAGVTYGSSTDPAVAFDSAGNAFYAYMLARTAFDPYRPVVAILPAGATQWEGPFPVTPGDGDDDKLYIAVDASPSSPYRGRVYVAWDRNNPDTSQNVYLGRSDGGRAWVVPVRVDDAGSSGSAIYATPATGPSGEVYVVWNDYAAANAGFLKIDRSTNGGATFGPDRTVTDLRLNLQPDPTNAYSIYAIPAQPNRGIAACPSIGVDISNGPRRGTVYVCYCDRAVGKGHDDTDIFVRRSTDGGVTFSPPVRVNDDVTPNSQFFPWMNVDPVDGSLNIAFYDTRDDPNNRKAHVYMSRSRNGGVTFEPNTRVTSLPSDQSSGMGDPVGNDYGDYLGLAAFGGQVVSAWTDDRDGKLNQAWAATFIQPAAPPDSLRQAACDLTVPPGTSLATREMALSARLAGPSATLIPEWEIKAASVAFDGSGTVSGAPIAFSGAPVTVSLPLPGLADGGYHWRVRARRGDGLGTAGAWMQYGSGATGTDFAVGARYTVTDAARALRISGGLTVSSPADLARLGSAPALSGQACDTRVSLADALLIARAAFAR